MNYFETRVILAPGGGGLGCAGRMGAQVWEQRDIAYQVASGAELSWAVAGGMFFMGSCAHTDEPERRAAACPNRL